MTEKNVFRVFLTDDASTRAPSHSRSRYLQKLADSCVRLGLREVYMGTEEESVFVVSDMTESGNHPSINGAIGWPEVESALSFYADDIESVQHAQYTSDADEWVVNTYTVSPERFVNESTEEGQPDWAE